MKISEEAVFRWVVIVLAAAVSVILVAVVVGSLAGVLWALVLVIAAAWHGFRWVQSKRRSGQL